MLTNLMAAFASTLIIILGVPALTTPCELSGCKVLWELPPEDDCAWAYIDFDIALDPSGFEVRHGQCACDPGCVVVDDGCRFRGIGVSMKVKAALRPAFKLYNSGIDMGYEWVKYYPASSGCGSSANQLVLVSDGVAQCSFVIQTRCSDCNLGCT